MQLWAIYPELTVAGLALLLVPIAGWVRGRWRSLPSLLALLGFLISLVLTARMLPWEPVRIFQGTYSVDGFAHVIKLLLELGGLLTVLLIQAHFKGQSQAVHAPVAVLFATLGGMGLASSTDLGMIILFFQMMSFASYLLVGMVRTDRRGNEAALKFFIYAATALAIMAYGLTFLFGLTGSLDLQLIGMALQDADGVWVAVALGLVLIGFGLEMAVVPFHFWVPDTYQGATAPVAGFVSVVPKIAAFAAALRFLTLAYGEDLAHWSVWIAVLAAVTMTYGNLLALRQSRLKSLLAYSSIAQAGYVLMAVAVAGRTGNGVHAAGYYLAAFLFMNMGAFAVVAQVERAMGTDLISAVRGFFTSAPWSAAVLLISLLSLAGIPPLAGFMGKVFVFAAAIEGGFTWLAVLGVINMVVGLYYYVAVAAQMSFGVSREASKLAGGGGYQAALAMTVAGTVWLGVWPGSVVPVTRHLTALFSGMGG